MSGMTIGYTNPKANIQINDSRAYILLRIAVKEGIIDPSKFDGGSEMFKTVDAMKQFYEKLDAEISSKLAAENVKPRCRAKCPECCSYTFAVTTAEYDVIRKFIQEDSISYGPLRRLAAEQLERYKRDCPEDYNRFAVGTNEETLNEINAKRFEPCIFQSGGKCSVYPVRPIVCRTFGIVYSHLFDPRCNRIVRYYLKHSLYGRKFIDMRNQIMIFLPEIDELLDGIYYIVRKKAIAKTPFWTPEVEYDRAAPLFWRLGTEEENANVNTQ